MFPDRNVQRSSVSARARMSNAMFRQIPADSALGGVLHQPPHRRGRSPWTPDTLDDLRERGRAHDQPHRDDYVDRDLPEGLEVVEDRVLDDEPLLETSFNFSATSPIAPPHRRTCGTPFT
jgi:hypothetical protein